MEIQVALDRMSLDQARRITAEVAAHVDWIEVGTSLLKEYGKAGLQAVVESAGATPVLADLKTVDDVRWELALAYGAGARSVTVLGLAPRVTVDTAVEVSAEWGRELVVDLMGLDDGQIAALAAGLPGTVVLAAHVSKDAQAAGERALTLLGPWAAGRRVALAGGLTAADLPGLVDWPDLRVIVGSAVTKASDPLDAVRELRRSCGKDAQDHA
ncbi:MAG TPA: orotidine 5'-phosphate decarboxylase / HUMPS family protein [Micromonosporaceae bacterium]